jgi:hypothetical protein
MLSGMLTLVLLAVALGIVGLVVQQKEETTLSKIMLGVAAIILFLIGMGIRAWD